MVACILGLQDNFPNQRILFLELFFTHRQYLLLELFSQDRVRFDQSPPHMSEFFIFQPTLPPRAGKNCKT